MDREFLEEQREKIQDDLISLLDGLDNNIVSNACQIVVDRFRIIFDENEKQ